MKDLFTTANKGKLALYWWIISVFSILLKYPFIMYTLILLKKIYITKQSPLPILSILEPFLESGFKDHVSVFRFTTYVSPCDSCVPYNTAIRWYQRGQCQPPPGLRAEPSLTLQSWPFCVPSLHDLLSDIPLVISFCIYIYIIHTYIHTYIHML